MSFVWIILKYDLKMVWCLNFALLAVVKKLLILNLLNPKHFKFNFWKIISCNTWYYWNIYIYFLITTAILNLSIVRNQKFEQEWVLVSYPTCEQDTARWDFSEVILSLLFIMFLSLVFFSVYAGCWASTLFLE